MEDTLRAVNSIYGSFDKVVLILVLMEDTLRECMTSIMNIGVKS